MARLHESQYVLTTGGTGCDSSKFSYTRWLVEYPAEVIFLSYQARREESASDGNPSPDRGGRLLEVGQSVQLRSLILLVFFALVGACTEVGTVGQGQDRIRGSYKTIAISHSPYFIWDISGTLLVVPDGERYIRWLPDGSRILFNGFVHPFGPSWPAPDLYSVALNRATRLSTWKVRARLSWVLLG